MEDYIVRKIKNIAAFQKEKFLGDKEFIKLITNVYKSSTKEEVQKNLTTMAKEVKKNTSLEYDYKTPILWENWGLNSSAYLGSGGGSGSKSGYGSIPDFGIPQPDIFYLLRTVLFTISYFKKSNSKEILDEVWKNLIEDTKKNEYEDKYITEIIGEIWLSLMPPEDLKRLQIRFTSGLMFERRSFEERTSMPLGTVISENLLPLALALAAKYNNEQPNHEDKIYFEETGEYGYIRLIAPKSELLSHALLAKTKLSDEELKERQSKYQIAELNLRELVESLDHIYAQILDNKAERKRFIIKEFNRSLI